MWRSARGALRPSTERPSRLLDIFGSFLRGSLSDVGWSRRRRSFAQAEALHKTFGFKPAKFSGPAAMATAIVPALAQLGPELSKKLRWPAATAPMMRQMTRRMVPIRMAFSDARKVRVVTWSCEDAQRRPCLLREGTALFQAFREP